MNKILSLVTIVATLTTLNSCQKSDKDQKKETPLSQTQDGNQKVTRQGGADEKPFRRYIEALGDCDNIQENCSPVDGEVNSTRDNSCMPCRVLRELLDNTTFRAEASFRYDHINRSFPDVSSQEELNQVDDETFYATLFPNLTNSQREMFYSGEYQILLKHNEGHEKFFVLFGELGQSAGQIESQAILAVPFTFNYN